MSASLTLFIYIFNSLFLEKKNMHFITSKLLCAKTSHNEMSTVMELARSNTVTVPCFFFVVLLGFFYFSFRFYTFINLFIYL